MFPEGKIIEIFSICDDFSKVFDKTVEQNAITGGDSPKKRKYHRDGLMSDSEVMTILILFHNSGYRCLKHFIFRYVCKYMRHLFPKVVSYNRFVELERHAVVKLAILVKSVLMGKCTGISFIDSTILSRVSPREASARWDGSMVSSCISSVTRWAKLSTSCLRQETLTIGSR